MPRRRPPPCPIPRDEAMRAVTHWVEPCALCRPDTKLGIL
ncbi:DUF6233 domain-containing protein [Streptomyces sp. NPDC017993]